jgi:hypothetical protein
VTRPAAIGRFRVGAAGILDRDIDALEPPPRAPALADRTAVPQRLGTAIRTRIASSRKTVATVTVLIRRRDGAGRLALAPVSRKLAPRQRWHVAVPLSAGQRASVKGWLRAGHRVVARIEVRLVSDVGPGNATAVHSRGVPLIH